MGLFVHLGTLIKIDENDVKSSNKVILCIWATSLIEFPRSQPLTIMKILRDTKGIFEKLIVIGYYYACNCSHYVAQYECE